MAEKTPQVSWNVSLPLIQELGRLRARANALYIAKEIPTALRTLTAMKMSVIHSFNSEECIFLEELEKKVRTQNSLVDFYGSRGFMKPKVYYDAFGVLDRLYIQFNDALQRLLEKYGYLIEKKSDKTKLVA